MGHQYYKIICLHGEKDIFEDSKGNLFFLRPDAYEYVSETSKSGKSKKIRTIRKDINIEEYSTCGHSFYTQVLEKNLDTEYISEVLYKEFNLKDIHPKKKKNYEETFLGFSDAFINVKLTKESRKKLYSDSGFYCNGKKYVRYRRSASSAKSGNCLFVYAPIKNALDKWNNCGLQRPANQSELTSWEAYTALTLSGIQETFQIPRKSILIIRDLVSSFTEPGIAVTKNVLETPQETKSKVVLSAEYSDSIKIENKIWDGESLIDESIFDELIPKEFSDSHMLLLRNRFFKSCGFRTKLQKWFKNNNITNVNSLNGYTSAKKISDIKIVITESSLKYLKFSKEPSRNQYENEAKYNEAYIDWLGSQLQSWFVGLGNSHSLTFGIVKSDKPSRFFNGKMVHTNYQLLNTLGLNEEESHLLLKDTLDYLEKVKNNPAFFRFYLKNGLTLSMIDNNENDGPSISDTDNDEVDIDAYSSESTLFEYYNYQKKAVQQLLNYSDAAFNTPICKYVISKMMEDAKKQISKGRFLIPGTYAVLLGNPVELLCYIINKEYSLPNEPTDICVNDVIYPVLKNNEIYCTLFDDGEELCCSRSPHITMGNLFYGKNNHLKNTFGESIIEKYFSLSPQIVCVNSIKHNLLDRLNGADFDSDTMLITNHEIAVSAIKRQENMFPVPKLVKNDAIDNSNADVISPKQGLWETLESIDNILANNIVGQIVHCSQALNSILWTRYPDICRVDTKTYSQFESSYNSVCDFINNYMSSLNHIELEIIPNEAAKLVQSLETCFALKELNFYKSTIKPDLIEYVQKLLFQLINDYYKSVDSQKTDEQKNIFRISITEFIFSKMYGNKYIDRYNYVNYENSIYNNICILEVLSNLEIDKAKRVYIENISAAFNVVKEIKQIYELKLIGDRFMLPAEPDFFINIKKQYDSSTTNQVKVMGINFEKIQEAASYSTTLRYIYDIAMNDISRAQNKNTISLSSMLNTIDGTRHHSDDFDRIKLIAAYYYLKLRTCHNISNNGKNTPDYGKCAYYVQQCYIEIHNKIKTNKAFHPSFMIFSLLQEIDEHQEERNSKNNTLTIESMFKQINGWGKGHKRNLAHATDFIVLVSSISEKDTLHSKETKSVLTETYSRLLQAALINILAEDSEICRLLISPSVEIKNIQFDETGDFSIYGHKCKQI